MAALFSSPPPLKTAKNAFLKGRESYLKLIISTKVSFSENPATRVLTGQVLGHSWLSAWFYSLKSTKKWSFLGQNQPFLAHSRHLEFQNGDFPSSKHVPYISASFETERTRFRRAVLEKTVPQDGQVGHFLAKFWTISPLPLPTTNTPCLFWVGHYCAQTNK